MSTEPATPESPAPTCNTIDPDTYSHLDEVRRLRATLARLEARLEQVSPDDPAMLVRLTNAIARLSDSIVRALAAHHKLQLLAEKKELQQGWDDLKAARDSRQLDDQIYRRNRAEWFRQEQAAWLSRLSEVARDAASGDPTTAREVAAGLQAYIDRQDYAYPPDRPALAAAREHEASGGAVPWPTTHNSYSPYT